MVRRAESCRRGETADNTRRCAIAAQNLTTASVRGVDLAVHDGELVGLGGLRGQGQEDLLLAIYGALPFGGRLELSGQPVRFKHPQEAMAQGVAYVPGERNAQGLLDIRSILENLQLPSWGKYGLLLRMAAARRDAAAVASDLRLVMAGLDAPVSSLSGGNAQKVVLGKWLLRAPQLLLLNDPTKGVDVGAKAEIYKLLADLRRAGAAILFYSSDDEELLGLCDRVLVLHDGHVRKELVAGSSLTRANLIAASVAAEAADASAAETLMLPAQRERRNERQPEALCAPQPLSLCAAPAGDCAGRQSLSAAQPLHGACLQWQLPYLPAADSAGRRTNGRRHWRRHRSLDRRNCLDGDGGARHAALRPNRGMAAFAGAIALGVVAGMLAGALNGFAVSILRLQPIVTTYATSFIFGGIALWVLPRPGGYIPTEIVTLYRGAAPLGLPLGVYVAAVVVALWVLLRATRFGRYLFAVGGKADAAYTTGVPVNWVRFSSYVVAGLMAAMCALAISLATGAGDPRAGDQMTLDSVVAVVLGGTRLSGGQGGVAGTVMGVIILGLIRNIISFANVPTWWQTLVDALIIVIALAAPGIFRLLRGLGRK